MSASSFADMRVLFVCTQMEAGGVQTRATKMRKRMEALGVHAKVVFLYKKREAFAETEDVYPLLDGPPRSLADVTRSLRTLNTLLSEFKPTAIVGMAHYSSPIAAFLGWWNGVPRRIATQTNPYSTIPRAGRILDRVAGTLGLYTANICASRTIFDGFSRFNRFYKRRVVLVRNGVDLTPDPRSQLACREALGLPLDKTLLVSCGRLSAQKNHSFLLPLLEQLPDNVCLAVMGEGEQRELLETEIRNRGLQARAFLLGEQGNSRIPTFLKAGDIFVFPSRFEAFGLALVEAMLAGLPVVVSDHDALLEVVGSCGITLPLQDPGAWLSAVDRLCANPEERALWSQKAAERGKLFEFDSMLDGFMKECGR